MKNTITTIILCAFTVFAFSQIKVLGPNGDVGVGTTSPTEKLDVNGFIKSQRNLVTRTGLGANTIYNRTDASAFAIGAGDNAIMSFDENFTFNIKSSLRQDVLDGKLSTSTHRFRVRGSDGFVGIGVTNPTAKLHVNGAINYVGSTNNVSDKRLKKDVNTFGHGLKEVMALNPVSYMYNGEAGIENTETHIGLLAQELQAVAPELVNTWEYQKENNDGEVIESAEFLSINESAIKYMLVNAIQEQNEIVEAQKEELQVLKEEMSELKALVAHFSQNGGNVTPTLNTVNGGAKEVDAYELELSDNTFLGQNQPNPFNGSTVIRFSVPDNVSEASIRIYSIDGKFIDELQLTERGEGQLTIEAGKLSAGTYSYTMILDGANFETKFMVLENK